MSFGEYFQAFGSLGDTFRAHQKEDEQKVALSKLGDLVQNGDYTGAARLAFNAGDASTGMNLVKMGQAVAQQRATGSEMDRLLNGLYPTGGATAGGGTTGADAGPSTPRLPTFADASGADGSYISNLFKRESGGNPNAKAPTSSAQGLGQFTTGTWNAVARQHPELGLTPDGRTNPDQMIRATQAFTADNEKILANAGLPVNDATRYSLHFLGSGGGPKFVAGALSNPDAPAVAFVQPGQASANRTIFYNRDGTPKSAGQVLSSFDRSFGGGGGGRQQVAQAPVAVPTFGTPSADAGAMPGAMQMPPLPPPRPTSVAALPEVEDQGDAPAAPLPPARPIQVASNGPVQLPTGASGLNPANPAPAAAPTVPSMVGQPAPAEIGVGSNILSVPSRTAGLPQTAMPAPTQVSQPVQPPRTPQVLIPQSMTGAGVAGTVMNRGVPVAQVGAPAAASGQADDGDAAPAVSSQVRAQVSAQAPAQLAQAGLPAPIATGIAAAPPASQARIQALLRASMLPGLSEGQSKVVSTLLTNELEQTKLPDTAKQYIFAKSASGGGYDGTYADFVNKSKDEGAKIEAQMASREKWLIAHGLDPKDPGNQAWIMGGKTTSGRVLKPGDALVGANGTELARNAGAAGSAMPDQTADFLAERVMAGDTKALIGLGRGAQGAENLSKIQGLIAQKSQERGMDATDILRNAAVASGLGAQERSLGTSAGRMSAAAAEAEQAANFALQASDKVARTQFVPVNRVLQMIQSNTGDPNIREFNAANNTLVNTYARAVSPTGAATVADKQHAYDLLNTANTKEQYASVVDLLQREIRAAHKAPQQARDTLEAERQAAKRGGAPAGAGATMVPNPLAPDQAPAAPPAQATRTPAAQFRDGQTATGPNGQKVVFSRGQWVPLNATPKTTASPQAGGAL